MMAVDVCAIEPGTLRHRVRVQEQVEEKADSFGDVFPEEWRDVRNLWVMIEPLRGREFFEAEQSQNTVTHRVTSRYVPDVSPGMRLDHKGRHLHIVSVINVEERNVKLEMMCRESV